MDKVGMPGDDGGATWLAWLADPQRREYADYLADEADPGQPAEDDAQAGETP